MGKKMEKVKNFVKKEAFPIGIAVGSVLCAGTFYIIGKRNLATGAWIPLNLDGLKNIRSAFKWNSRDEWNGVVRGSLHKVTMDELCETGKAILSRGGLEENAIIEEVVFITTKDK